MKKKALMILVLLAIVGASVAFAQQAKTYHLEIWDISSSTYNAIENRTFRATTAPREDAYVFVRSASGSTLRSSDNGLSIEAVRQKLLDVDNVTTSYRNAVSNNTSTLQQSGTISMFAYSTGTRNYYIYAWMRAEN